MQIVLVLFAHVLKYLPAIQCSGGEQNTIVGFHWAEEIQQQDIFPQTMLGLLGIICRPHYVQPY